MEKNKSSAADGFTGAEYEFLPAALEVQQTPPSPIGRILIWLIVAFFLTVLLWASFGRVDIVATAQGKVIPTGRVKVIQPMELGVVRAIHVREGQTVAEGDLLLELDPTVSDAEHARVMRELLSAELDNARMQALLARIDPTTSADAGPLAWPASASNELISIQLRLLESALAEYRARRSAAESELARRRAELATTEMQIERLTATLPLITQRSEALGQLSSRQLAPRQQFLELEQQRLEQQYGLRVEQTRQAELRAGIRGAEQQLSAIDNEFRSTTIASLADAKRRRAEFRQEATKTGKQSELQRLRAPSAGVVQQLAVHTIGGVVQPAQELMRIVPPDDAMEVEAWLLNRDVGFVREQQDAQIKVDAFPFTKYGILPGKIQTVSDDAVADEKLGLVYRISAQLERSTVKVEGRDVRLSPGMTVAVEVKTGNRRIIEFFLAPLLRYRQESIRER